MISLGLFIFLGSITGYCHTQIAYSRVLPYDPRYLLKRIPVRRSIDAEYQRVHLPISRYFPQVDTQVPAAYLAAEPVAYRLPNGEVYALPSVWSEDDAKVVDRDNGDAVEYDNYDDYENEYEPIYARPVYAPYNTGEVYGSVQEDPEPSDELYNGLVANYLLGEEVNPTMDQMNLINVKRRKENAVTKDDVVVEKKSNNTTDSSSSSLVKNESISQNKETTSTTPHSDTSSTPDTFNPLKIAASASRVHKSGDKVAIPQGMWQKFDDDNKGQKEYPLYRPFQVADHHKQALEILQNRLSRAKNSVSNKNALPVIEKLMAAAHRSKDPLTEQLDNLKFRM